MTFGDRFYSVAELADITGYHRDSIYRAIESGALIAAKPGGKWLIAGEAINAWLDAATKTTEARRAAPPARLPAAHRRPHPRRARSRSTQRHRCARIVP